MTLARIGITVTAAAGGAAGTGAAAGRWQVAIAGVAGPLASHVMVAEDAGGSPYPVTAAGGLAAGDVATTLDELRDGRATAAAGLALGRHLFDVLLAPAWTAIAAGLVAAPPDLLELAVDLDGAPALRALPWELMAAPGGWLAQGVTVGGALVDVAITRRTTRGVATAPPLVNPLRYLFVIGTGLDDEIRAGGECFGLLRQLGPEVQERIIERVSLGEVGRVVAEFDPHVVHVICHGRETESSGVELELWDAARNLATRVTGTDLAAALVRTGADQVRRAPAMVVLSACSSGDRMLPSDDGGLARALIAAGVPVVIGTAAAIRDQACRLFTRGLGEAIAVRTPLLAAASRGRRAALRSRDLPTGSFDWGLVQVVLGHDVDGGLVAAPAAPESDEARVARWLAGSGLEIDLPASGKRSYPPLCGGTEAIEAFYRLLAGPHAALVLIARPPREGIKVGKRRLLSELAAIAIRAGHVPVTLIASQVAGPPRDPGALAAALGRAFKAAWKRHDLGPPTSAQLAALAAADPIDADLLADALEADSAALRARARQDPLIARASGQVVIMLHDVHAYGDAIPLVLELLRIRGANLRDAGPVVLTWRWTPANARDTSHKVHDEDLRQTTIDCRSTIEAVDLLPLAPIDPYRADLGLATIPLAAKLALQRILLHPYRKHPPYASRRWLLDLRGESPAQRDTLRALIGNTWGCCPGQFDDDAFLIALNQVLDRGALTAADDDDVLAAAGRRP